MKNFITAICFVLAIPFLVMGFAWYFITYCFTKGKELCETFFEFLE